MTTTNLANFGYRELIMLEKLLKAMREQGLPNDFYDEEVHPMMNQSSGNVFLINSDCNQFTHDNRGHKNTSFILCKH